MFYDYKEQPAEIRDKFGWVSDYWDPLKNVSIPIINEKDFEKSQKDLLDRSFSLNQAFHDMQVTKRCAYFPTRHVAIAHSGNLGTGLPEKMHSAKAKKNALSAHLSVLGHSRQAIDYCRNKLRLEITINSTMPLSYPEFQHIVKNDFIHFAEVLEVLPVPWDYWIDSCKSTLQMLDSYRVFTGRDYKELEPWQQTAFAHFQNRMLIADMTSVNALRECPKGWKIEDQLEVISYRDI